MDNRLTNKFNEQPSTSFHYQPPSPWRRLTADEEAEVMIATLRNVISGSTDSLSIFPGAYGAVPDTQTCRACGISGCLEFRGARAKLNFPSTDYTTTQVSSHENNQPRVQVSSKRKHETSNEKKPSLEKDISVDDSDDWMNLIMNFSDGFHDSTDGGNVWSV
ncbi:AP2/ERF domain-containing protein [Artemisia annua]|uniref:AP2/ERF domain-containing protein n=1 Tax=Artemisia annua TaxID=35608 RepID=A0A2U1PGI1_ARTAN|nr:AP2/ERF domain-containing protein [Artemisia annua]